MCGCVCGEHAMQCTHPPTHLLALQVPQVVHPEGGVGVVVREEERVDSAHALLGEVPKGWWGGLID